MKVFSRMAGTRSWVVRHCAASLPHAASLAHAWLGLRRGVRVRVGIGLGLGLRLGFSLGLRL